MPRHVQRMPASADSFIRAKRGSNLPKTLDIVSKFVLRDAPLPLRLFRLVLRLVAKASIALFTNALRATNVSSRTRSAIKETVEYYEKRLDEIEEELTMELLEDLPEAPTTKPVAHAKGARARDAGPTKEATSKAGEGTISGCAVELGGFL